MNKIQLKYSFKKEWSHFMRTLRFWGVIIAIFSFAISDPMMFKFTGVIMQQLSDNSSQAIASVSQQSPGGDLLGGLQLDDMADMYSDAGMMFSTTLVSFAAYALLITMLLLMSASGGEQKKRAMIVPMCSGLDYKNYLLPKFTIYPLTVLAVAFLSGLTAGGLCNAMFPNNKIDISMMLLAAAMMAVYMAFIISIFIALGLCTSHPGIMAPLVFIGQMFAQNMLNGFGLYDYHPFSLITYIGSDMFIAGREFDLAGYLPSILVAIGLSVLISCLMYGLSLGVLNAKKIDNQAEDEPEF